MPAPSSSRPSPLRTGHKLKTRLFGVDSSIFLLLRFQKANPSRPFQKLEGSLGILREHPNGRHEHAKTHFRVSLQTFTSPFSFFFVDYSPMEAMSYKSFQLNQIDSELLCLSRASQSDIHTETHGAGAVAFSGTFKSFNTNSAPGHIWRI